MNDSIKAEVLLVEDSAEDAELALRELQRHKVSNYIHHVSDGAEALDYLLSRGKYANGDVGQLRLVLLDLKLPKLDGLEVLNELRKHPGLKKIPIVVLSSSKESSDIKNAYGLGANSYIVKPVDFGKYSQAVKNLSHYWLSMNEAPST